MMREFKPELKIYTHDELPTAYEHQIRSYIRMLWWDVYLDTIDPQAFETEYDPVYVCLVGGDCLYSALKVNRKVVTHQGTDYVFYGIGDVFTYPAFRKRGYGTWVVREGTDYIRQQIDGDFALLWAEEDNVDFYQRLGWEHIMDITVTMEDPQNPEPSDEEVMMIFLSERVRNNRDQFVSHDIYFGEDDW